MSATHPHVQADPLETLRPATADFSVITFILAGGGGQRLEPLTVDRPKPAVPAGGRYKLIDFTLSNCLNSGLGQLYVLVQQLSAELITYVHEGWRPYFPPTRGTADALLRNRALIERSAASHVLVLAGDHIYKMDYRGLLAAHQRTGAGVTVSAVEGPLEVGSRFGIMQRDATGRITSFTDRPPAPEPMPHTPPTSAWHRWASMCSTRLACSRSSSAMARR